ncbi:MAG: alpha/beta hydrolase [Candidatus Lokiarchaeota archaeon]|nr:alpha/beta hydrolase [Candidatus Lokiarchaeota archaeon]
MTEQYADVNGVKLCYEVFGEGYPLFLIHGFGAKKDSWIAQVPVLSKHFKIITLDNRGAGKSERPDAEYTMEVFADDINGLMEHLGIEKANIAGWSLGGMIVQNFILKYPERVNKLILINTNYGFPDESGPEVYKNMRLNELKTKKEDPAKAWWSGARSGFYIKFRKQLEADPSKKWYGLWSAEELIESSTIDPPTEKDINMQAGALKTHDTFERLSTIKSPTLILAASHDRLMSKASMEQIRDKIPNSILVVIDKAGHRSPLEKAPEVNQQIIEFLKD